MSWRSREKNFPPAGAQMLAAALAFGCAAGCVSYHPRPLSPEKTAAELAARSLRDEGLRQFMKQNLGREPTAWPLPRWDFASLTLAAWYFHPDMALARAQLEAARAGKKAAAERPEPGLNFSPQYTSNAGDLSPWTLGFSLDLPLETAGKRARRMAASTAAEKSAEYQLAVAAWQVCSRLRAALVAYWAAQEGSPWLDRRVADETAALALLEQRHEAGEIAAVALAQARATLEQDRLAAEETRRQQRLARAELAQAIGVPESSLVEVQFDFDGLTQAPPPAALPPAEELQKLALQTRPDILAALADYDAAEENLRLEIARQYPDFHLGTGYTWDQGAKRWTVGLGFTLPVFNRNRGAIAQAEAGRAAAQARFEAAQSRALGELESARANFQSASESLRVADDLERQQKAQFDAAQARFEAGEISRIEFLQASALYGESERARIGILAQAQAAFGALQDAVQHPLDDAGPTPPASSH